MRADTTPAARATGADAHDIALVGLALRVPGAHGPEAFWRNLRGGVESVQAFTDEELRARGVPERLLRDPRYVKAGPLLPDIDLFDAEFFGFSPRDAAIMDPQHRQFLECAWEALEDAGHPPQAFHGPVGVFAGCGMGTYFARNLLGNPGLVEDVGLFLLRHTGNDKDFLPTRVSYCLDLRGPSLAVQTACSTSLVAVHVAAQSLLAGECDMALAGGVTIDILQGAGYLHEEGGIVSPDGRCRAFERRGAGTVFGSGAGVVVLRRLSDALRDGDRVYAVIKGSAVNNDGAAKVGYLAPSVDGLAAVIAEALASADVPPDAIDFVEAHGSGTPMGTAIEVAAMRQIFGRSSGRAAPCGLGSVKANVGHLDTAAGVTGLIKAALALHHGELPPAPDFETPDPSVPAGDPLFRVVDRLQPWPRGPRRRRAGVTSMGVGGTNAHVVLEEAPVPAPASASARDWQLLSLSARSQGALRDASTRLAAHLRAHPEQPLPDVGYTLAVGRHAFAHRMVLACRDGAEGAALLEAADPRRVASHVAGTTPASVAFLLPGGGAQHVRMGLDLYRDEPAFRERLDRGVDAFRRLTSRDLRSLWIGHVDPARAALDLERPSLQLPALFLLEDALAHWWTSLGVQPDALIGHSLGEYTAACLAGVMTFDDALGLVALRGELFEQLPPGGMLSVALPVAELLPLLGDEVDVAAVNAPCSTVVSGEPAALDALAARLAAQGADARRVPIAVAAHSRRVDPVLPRFRAYLADVALHPPRVPVVSNVTGTWLTDAQATDPEYWVAHLRGTVRFSDGLRTLLAGSERVALEVGPGRTLTSLARQHPDAARARGLVASMRHPDDEVDDTAQALTAFGQLWACGVPVGPSALWRGERRARVSLPTYAFQHQRHWIEPAAPARAAAAEPGEPERLALPARGVYRPDWRPAPVGAPEAPAARTWLLFLDAGGVGERLAARLRARGHAVHTVRVSDDDRRLDEHDWALAPERGRESYEALLRDLVARGQAPDRIVHLWLLTPDGSFRPGSNVFHQNQERGFYSLFFLAQALGEEAATGPVHVTVAANGLLALDGERVAHPSKATVLGPCRVAPRELPGLTCAVVDLPLTESRTPLRGRAVPQADRLAELLEAEVLAAPRVATVAHRDGARLEQAWAPLELPPAPDAAGGADAAGVAGAAPPAQPAPALRERGVYLVTGGLGGLGLAVAEDLARRARARLVLVGRTPLPPREDWDDWLARHAADDRTSRRLRALRTIEAVGGEVLPVCADVTDVVAMRGALAAARERFGALHGVLHCAGTVRDAPLLAKSQAEVEQVFAPKVHGTLVLDALLAEEELDLLVLFSSVSTVIAPPGQVDYVAANAFLDAYAGGVPTGRAPGARRWGRAVAVGWGVWAGTGMAADALAGTAAHGAPTSPGRAPAHPLLDVRGDDPSAPLNLRARYAPRTHWVLDEHRTREGFAVLPGTAYLELARAALVEAGEGPAFEARDVLLLSPLHVADEESREVEIELRPSEEGYAFQVRSRPAGGGWEVHAQARLLPGAPAAPPEAGPARAALEEAEARCAVARASSEGEGLPPVQAHRMRFGPRWHALRSLRLGDAEAVARLALRADLAADADAYGLHPALLDAALTCGLELADLDAGVGADAALWVPVSFERVRVHAPLGAAVASRARRRAGHRAGADTVAFDVDVVREDGTVALQAEGFSLRRSRLVAPTPWSAGGPAAAARSPRAADPDSPARAVLRRNHERGITLPEGCAALQAVLAAPPRPHVLASSLDLDGLVRQVDALVAAPGGPGLAHDRPAAPPDASPDGIERTLAGFWQELLGVRSVAPQDDFFALGGHSLVAVRLFARIKKAYRVEFPISLLFEAPTIERCAAEIRKALGDGADGPAAADERAPAPRFTHLVPMHPGHGGERTPFFLVAGMFGNVLNLRHLAHLLGNERRFYGLQARGLYGAYQPHETFEEMAADYLAEVRRVQPEGPYLLGGFSGGGLTAYEMALQLLEQGEQVALLAMLDTFLPSEPTLRPSERARIHWEKMRDRGPGYLAEWARNRVRWELGRLRRRGAEDEVAMPTEFRSEAIASAFRRALTRYEVRPYPGTITLLRPKLEVAHVLGPGRSTNARREFVFHDNGWGDHAARVDVHEVPGDHDSMVLEPNVRVLAARLRRSLRAADDDAAQAAAPRADAAGARTRARDA